MTTLLAPDATVANMTTDKHLCARADPDLVFNDHRHFLDALMPDLNRWIIVGVFEEGNNDTGGDSDVVADCDATMPQQDRIIIDPDIISYFDVTALRVNHDATAGPDTVTDLDCALLPPEPRPFSRSLKIRLRKNERILTRTPRFTRHTGEK